MADEGSVRLVLGYAREAGTSLAVENVANSTDRSIELCSRAGGVYLGAHGKITLAPGGAGIIDATEHGISNVADPVDGGDAVNRRFFEANASPPTGLLAGGTLTAGVGTITVAAGAGRTAAGYVAWKDTEVATAEGVRFLFVGDGGAIEACAEPPASSDVRGGVYLGGYARAGAQLAVVGCPLVAAAPAAQLRDLAVALGPVHLGGDVLAGVRNALRFTKTAGAALAYGAGYARGGASDPHRVEFPPLAAGASFRYCRRDGALGPPVTELDPEQYEGERARAGSSRSGRGRGGSSDDEGGDSRGGSKKQWTLQPVFVTFTGEVVLQPGQTLYTNGKKAAAGYLDPFAVSPFLAEFAVAVGFVALRLGGRNAASTADAVFGQYGRFGLGR